MRVYFAVLLHIVPNHTEGYHIQLLQTVPKNLVLFDKGMATAVGDIKDFIVIDEEVQLND